MSTVLQKCIDITPNGVIVPWSLQDYRLIRVQPWWPKLRATTSWLRMWADWPTLMPDATGFDPAIIGSLDAQIALARRDGLRIVLTLYRFPTWANGTDRLTAAELAATMPDRKASATAADTSAKSLLFRYPDDVTAGSAWGDFVERIVSRYSRGNPQRPALDATIDVLEVANEPNLQWWPQQGPSRDPANAFGAGDVVVHDVVARMFATARTIVARHGDEPMLAGPGAADSTAATDSRLRTGYDTLSDRLLPALASAAFSPGPRFAWTHHNYADVAYATSRTADVRRRLIGRWAGWPAGDGGDPQILVTEGGVTLRTIARRLGIADPVAQRAKQAELLTAAFRRLSGPEGAGVALVTQYLFHTDPRYDSGLCETAERGGARRPAFAAWRALPSA